MRIGPRYKIARRLGAHIFDKTSGPKFTLHLARKKTAQGRKFSRGGDFAKALLEKQKVRFHYGIAERQFKRYALDVIAKKTANQDRALYEKLETRLDNVVYRLGLAASRAAARQMVCHCHIRVNGKRVNMPSYGVYAGDVISVRPGSMRKAIFNDISSKLQENQKEVFFPPWLTVEPKKVEAKITGMPQMKETGTHFDFAPVLEFYKR